jgi:hypothetical protein
MFGLSGKKSMVPVVVLPFLHLVVCMVIDGTGNGGSWDWFLMSLVDFPVFIAVATMHITSTPFVIFTVLGTLWWLVVSVTFVFLYRRIVE